MNTLLIFLSLCAFSDDQIPPPPPPAEERVTDPAPPPNKKDIINSPVKEKDPHPTAPPPGKITDTKDLIPLIENELFKMMAPKKAYIPQKQDYEGALENFKKWADNVNNPEYYKDFTLKFDNKQVKFTELSDFKKSIFYIYQCEILSKRLRGLQNAWFVDLGYSSDLRRKAEVERSSDFKFLAKDQIQGHIDKLVELRKEHAVKFEKIAEEVLEKHKKEIPEKDRQHYLKQIKNWNAGQGLTKQ